MLSVLSDIVMAVIVIVFFVAIIVIGVGVLLFDRIRRMIGWKRYLLTTFAALFIIAVILFAISLFNLVNTVLDNWLTGMFFAVLILSVPLGIVWIVTSLRKERRISLAHLYVILALILLAITAYLSFSIHSGYPVLVS